MINLYYDKIYKKSLPLPNGITSAGDFTKIGLPYANHEYSTTPLLGYTEFLSAMKVCKVKYNLYTGSKTTKNLFYPLELNQTHQLINNSLTKYISEKVKRKIAKGKYKLLLICNRLGNSNYSYGLLKKRIDELIEYGISKNNIFVLTSDLNCSYKRFLDIPNMYGIDWWQIYSQSVYKSKRSGLKHYQNLFPLDLNFAPSPFKYELDYEKWNPSRLFTALTMRQRSWDYSLIVEILYQNIDKHGDWYFDETLFKLPDRVQDVLDMKSGLAEVSRKQYILGKKLFSKKIHNQKVHDTFYLDRNNFYESLFNIVVNDSCVTQNNPYLDSINLLSPGIGIWRQIAEGHPFLVLGDMDTMTYLNKEGYFTYHDLAFQNYDSYISVPKRVKAMCEEIQRLSGKNIEEVKNSVIPIANKNKEKFFAKDNGRKFWQLFLDMRYESPV